MAGLLPDIDPDGLLEYSVVYTDRSLNHMSQSFQTVMNDISATLKHVYQADAVAVVPGSGTFAMEAVARQFAQNAKCMVLRNGWFSYRWSQILNMADLPSEELVLKARRTSQEPESPFAPVPVNEVVSAIKATRPDIVFAPHVETASGMILPEDYIRQVAAAVHEVGGIFVLDCIASGTLWIDMQDCGVDILISAPQKGWSGSPCCGLGMVNQHVRQLIEDTESNSFACDLKKWLHIMEAYEQGGHAYHATMPTDSLTKFRNVMLETEQQGFYKVKAAQLELGRKVREILSKRGITSVAAEGFEAPGVVVSYTRDAEFQNGRKFLNEGMQIAAGVPLQCDEPDDFQTFRLGLFGLEKLNNIDRTVAELELVLSKLLD